MPLVNRGMWRQYATSLGNILWHMSDLVTRSGAFSRGYMQNSRSCGGTGGGGGGSGGSGVCAVEKREEMEENGIWV